MARVFVRSGAGILLLAALTASEGCRHFEPAPLSAADGAAALDGRSLEDPGLRIWLEHAIPQRIRAWPLARWDLEALTLAAYYFHPSLDVARAQWQVAEAGVRTAGARPNPSLSVTPQYVANAAAGSPAWVVTSALDWPIETAGKRGRRIEGAEHLAAAARLELDAMAWQVRAELRSRAVDVSAAGARAEQLTFELAAQREIVELLEQRVQAGAASLAEVAPARVAALQAAADLAESQRASRESRVRLAEAIGVPEHALGTIEIDVPLAAQDAPGEVEVAELRRQALQERPDLLAALAQYEATQAALRLEIARQYPDLRIGPGYEYDQGLNKWAVVGVTVELPVLDRNQGPIGEAEARRAEAAARFLALQAKVIAELERALSNRDATLEALAGTSEMLGAERERVREAEQALAAGATDRLALETARVELARAERLHIDAQASFQQARGDVEAAVQAPLQLAVLLEQGRAAAGGVELP